MTVTLAPESGASRPRALYSLNSMFPVQGAVAGVIALSAQESAVRTIMRKLIGEPHPGEDLSLMLAETLTEILNIIIGNATQSLREINVPIRVFPPFANAIGGKTAFLEEADDVRTFHTPFGSFILFILTSQR